MVDQLNAFAGESRASPARSAPKASSAARQSARRRRHLEGSHDTVNFMAGQSHRTGARIVKVVTAVADGDLKQN